MAIDRTLVLDFHDAIESATNLLVAYPIFSDRNTRELQNIRDALSAVIRACAILDDKLEQTQRAAEEKRLEELAHE